MNKTYKYALRTIIIGIPTILTFKSFIHISNFKLDYNECSSCLLSGLWLVALVLIAIITFILFVIEWWDEIWSKDDE